MAGAPERVAPVMAIVGCVKRFRAGARVFSREAQPSAQGDFGIGISDLLLLRTLRYQIK
jgi:hypothetical protein